MCGPTVHTPTVWGPTVQGPTVCIPPVRGPYCVGSLPCVVLLCGVPSVSGPTVQGFYLLCRSLPCGSLVWELLSGAQCCLSLFGVRWLSHCDVWSSVSPSPWAEGLLVPDSPGPHPRASVVRLSGGATWSVDSGGCGHRRQPCSATCLRPGQSAVMPLGAHGVLPTCPGPPSSLLNAPWLPWARLCLGLRRLNLRWSQQVTEVGAGGPGTRPATLGPVDEGGGHGRLQHGGRTVKGLPALFLETPSASCLGCVQRREACCPQAGWRRLAQPRSQPLGTLRPRGWSALPLSPGAAALSQDVP